MSEQAAEVSVSLGLSAAYSLQCETYRRAAGFLSSRLFTRSSISVWILSKSVVLKALYKHRGVDSVTKRKHPERSHRFWAFRKCDNGNVYSLWTTSVRFITWRFPTPAFLFFFFFFCIVNALFKTEWTDLKWSKLRPLLYSETCLRRQHQLCTVLIRHVRCLNFGVALSLFESRHHAVSILKKRKQNGLLFSLKLFI